MDLSQSVFSFCHGRCQLVFRTTLARPLSAGRIIIKLSCFKFLRASCISFVMSGLGGLACWRTLFTDLCTVSACSESSVLMADSTLATISAAGMLVGVTAKFNREDKLITHLFLSICGVWST